MNLARLARLRSEAVPTTAPAPPPAATPRVGSVALAAVEPPEPPMEQQIRARVAPAVEPVVVQPRRRVERAPDRCRRCGAESGTGHIFVCQRSPLVEVPVRVRPLDEMPPPFADMSPAERAALGMRVETPTQMEIR